MIGLINWKCRILFGVTIDELWEQLIYSNLLQWQDISDKQQKFDIIKKYMSAEAHYALSVADDVPMIWVNNVPDYAGLKASMRPILEAYRNEAGFIPVWDE